MKRPLIPLLIVLLAAAPTTAAVAAAEASTKTSIPDVRLPADALVATNEGGVLDVRAPGARRDDLLRANVDPRDVRTLADAPRAAIEAATGVRLPDLRPAHSVQAGTSPTLLPENAPTPSPSTAAADEPEPEPTGTISYPWSGGDLTGDGLDDVLVFDVRLPDETLTLRALRGTDGHQLWAIELDAADGYAESVGDVTGDGINDFLLAGLRIESEHLVEDCEDFFTSCHVEYDAEYVWTQQVLSGADGQRGWSRQQPGMESYRLDYQYQNEIVTANEHYEASLESTNYVVFSHASGDHDGDDNDDLVLEAVELDYLVKDDSERTVAITEDSGELRVRSTTRADVIRGLDGEILLSRTAEAAPRVASLEPVGDLVGSDSPDLLWNETRYEEGTYSCLRVADLSHCDDEPETAVELSLEVVDGETLATAWRSPLEGVDDAFAWAFGADISGDGTDDILVDSYSEAEGGFSLRFLSGSDGTLLWHRPVQDDAFFGEFPVLVDAIGGQPGNDLVLATFVDGFGAVGEEDPADIRLVRVEGATGETIFQTTRTFDTLSADYQGTNTLSYIGGMDDAGGDGGPDIYAGELAAGYEEDVTSGEWVLKEIGSAAVGEQGRTGDLLYERTSDQFMLIEGVPDLDGDGRSDAFEWHLPLEESGEYLLFVKRIVPDAPLWSRTLTSDEYWYGTLWPAGNHDGQPGEELVYGANVLDGERWSSLVGSLDGASGELRWTRSSA